MQVRFRLGKASMRSLKAMRSVRMRVLVSAQDAEGHAVAAAPVDFTMKAPRGRERAGTMTATIKGARSAPVDDGTHPASPGP